MLKNNPGSEIKRIPPVDCWLRRYKTTTSSAVQNANCQYLPRRLDVLVFMLPALADGYPPGEVAADETEQERAFGPLR